MRVFMTGIPGYIGTLLVPLLWARNHEVVGLDGGLFRECTLKALRPVEKTIRKDIRDVESRDLDGIDAVVHLAGLSNDPLGSLAELTYEINHEATVRLREIAKRAGYGASCMPLPAVVWRRRRRHAGRGQPGQSGHAVRRVQGARRGGLATARGFDVPRYLGLPARRHRLRRIAAAAVRPRGQQPGRLGGYDRPGRISRASAHSWRPLVHIEDIA